MALKPITFDQFMAEDGIECQPGVIVLSVSPSWVVNGEDRLSYTTIIRIIECCREYHWNTEIKKVDPKIDSICKSVTARFSKPILIGTTIRVVWQVTDLRQKSYTLRFTITDRGGEKSFAECDLVSVFYDPNSHSSLIPSEKLMSVLSNLAAA